MQAGKVGVGLKHLQQKWPEQFKPKDFSKPTIATTSNAVENSPNVNLSQQ